MYAMDPSTALTTRSTSAGAVRSSLSGVVILICGARRLTGHVSQVMLMAGVDKGLVEGFARRDGCCSRQCTSSQHKCRDHAYRATNSRP